MSIVLVGSTSGSCTLQEQAVAGTTTLTLPTTSGTDPTLTTPSFATTIGVGGATAAASGAGITFPSTASASSDANTLDDYEEGTWTPIVTPSSGSLTAYTSSGVYVKVGKLVTITGDFQLITVGTASGTVSVGGVPFNGTGPSTAYRIAIGSGSEDALTGVAYQVVLGGGGNNILLRTATGANITWTNGYGYIFTITYQASA